MSILTIDKLLGELKSLSESKDLLQKNRKKIVTSYDITCNEILPISEERTKNFLVNYTDISSSLIDLICKLCYEIDSKESCLYCVNFIIECLDCAFLYPSIMLDKVSKYLTGFNCEDFDAPYYKNRIIVNSITKNSIDCDLWKENNKRKHYKYYKSNKERQNVSKNVETKAKIRRAVNSYIHQPSKIFIRNQYKACKHY